ncbi:unnamed protein product [Mytilus coruscus]|uniref:Uncharacterized protein n=1 Tax=Mytilus coruscus TaxID=42192 RepID=A0A6J8AXE6_MYTCO|nr:unnamed protein product [Mytilus coruscus]
MKEAAINDEAKEKTRLLDRLHKAESRNFELELTIKTMNKRIELLENQNSNNCTSNNNSRTDDLILAVREKLDVTANHTDKTDRAENLDGLQTYRVIDESNYPNNCCRTQTQKNVMSNTQNYEHQDELTYRPQETNVTNHHGSAVGQSRTTVQLKTTEFDHHNILIPQERQQLSKQPVPKLTNVKGPAIFQYCMPPNVLAGRPMYFNAPPTGHFNAAPLTVRFNAAPTVRFNSAPTEHVNAAPTVRFNAAPTGHFLYWTSLQSQIH